MDKALNYVAWGLIAPFYWTHLARRSLSDRSTKQYLDSLSGTSLLSALSQALRPLTREADHVRQIFDKFAIRNGDHNKAIWNEKSFSDFVEAATGGVLRGTSSKLFWRCLSRAAYFPLNPPRATASSSEAMVDSDAFRRACALLAFQGIQLPGFEMDWAGDRFFSHDLRKKLPRISRFILSCLASRDIDEIQQEADNEDGKEKLNEEAVRAGEEDLTVENVLEIVSATQPPTYQRPFGDLINIPGVPQSAFRETAERLVLSAKSRPNYVPVHAVMQRSDLYTLLRTSILVCVCDERWRDGFSLHRKSDQMSSDIQQCRLDDDSSMTEELATSLMDWLFPNPEGNERDISYASFESFCKDSPTFLLLFFHLWASLFIPKPLETRKQPELRSGMSIRLTNSLSILNVCKLDSHLASEGRYFAAELQINLDFQAAALVFDAASLQNQRDLRSNLTEGWGLGSYFHVLIIHGEQCLLAIFIAPPDPAMEIWRARDGADYGYVWRYSWVDLTPSVRVMETGAMSVDENSQNDILVLKTRTSDAEITIDMYNRTLSRSAESLQWTSLKCYRMPGTANQVSKYPSKVERPRSP